MGKYLLRHAAGCYWLLDMEQDGRTLCRPLPLNETGAVLWRNLEKGMDRETCAEQLVDCYGITTEQALSDIQLFLEELRRNNVTIPDVFSVHEFADGI